MTSFSRPSGWPLQHQLRLSLTDRGLDRYLALPAPLQEIFIARYSDLEEPVRLELLNALETITELMDAKDIDASPLLVPESTAQ